MMRVAFIGAGAVGAPAALMAARLSNHQITVFDDRAKTSFHKTFVLLAGTCARLQDMGLWDVVQQSAHGIESVQTDFANSFGRLSLAGEDCESDCVGHSIGERDLIASTQDALAELDNVRMLAGAEVTEVRTDGSVCWRTDHGSSSDRFDTVAIAGLPQDILAGAGFGFSPKVYGHQAIVSTMSSSKVSNVAREKLLRSGAATIVPRKDGYGHILILPDGEAGKLADLDDSGYLGMLAERRWLPPPSDPTQLVARGMFRPRQRTATTPSLGRLILLGASACTVHPIGAQELNLGLRDAAVLARMLGECQSGAKAGDLAANFADLRSRDRRKVARGTGAAASLLLADVPGKLCVAGLLATAIDLVPPARRAALGLMVLR